MGVEREGLERVEREGVERERGWRGRERERERERVRDGGREWGSVDISGTVYWCYVWHQYSLTTTTTTTTINDNNTIIIFIEKKCDNNYYVIQCVFMCAHSVMKQAHGTYSTPCQVVRAAAGRNKPTKNK